MGQALDIKAIGDRARRFVGGAAAFGCANTRKRSASKSALVNYFHGVLFISLVSAGALGQTPVDRFMGSLETRAELNSEQRSLIQSTWQKCDGCDPSEFLTQGLTLLSPRFREGLDAYEAEDYSKAAGAFHELIGNDDAFLSTNAAAYEIKSLVAAERFAEANALLGSIPSTLRSGPAFEGAALKNVDVPANSYFAAEVEFLRGVVSLADLRYVEAAKTLAGFLKEYPDASPRLTVAAQQIVTELSHREAESIGEVVDLMNYSRRRLTQGEADEALHTRQQRIIDLLDKLIEDAQQKEQNQSNSEGGSQGGSGNQGGQSPSNPMQESMLPGGQAREGALREARRASPGEAWGAMPPAERERVLQALRETFPARYRQLVEQYYEEMAKKP